MHTGSNSIEAIMETCHAYFNIAFESGVSWKLTSYVPSYMKGLWNYSLLKI